MRNTLILSMLLICNLVAGAQSFSLAEGQSALVYSLPKTELCVEIVTEKITQQTGMFYRYSERYLATNNVITEEKTFYKLKSIKIITHAIPDANRTFSLIPNANSQLCKLSVNAQGILCGINVPVDNEVISPKTVVLPIKDNLKQATLLPLGEEYMMAGSEAKLAEGAAKQIYRIRESRLSLLTADVEKSPADGAALKSMLEGLAKMERELTELFIGKTSSEESIETVRLVPESPCDKKVLFRFSNLRGLVATDDLSGVPYYISVQPTTIVSISANPKEKAEKAGLYYVIPASTDILISDGVNTIFNGQFLIPQLGKTVPLPESLFKQQHLKVRIDSQTGRLLTIE